MSAEPLKILIADDSSTIRKFVTRAAEQSSHDSVFVEVADGTSCLTHLESDEFDIAFVDVNMPGLTGLDAIAKSRESGHQTFVVIMSTEQNADRLQNARELHVYEYLAKPFQSSDIVSVIENYSRFKKPSSVLIIDDSNVIRKVIKRVMKSSIFNLQVEDVADGASGLVAYQHGRHDIIFLDLNMPGINGLDTLAMLHKLKDDLKVVLITTKGNEEMAHTVDMSQVQGILYKPFYPADVDRILHNCYGLRVPSLDDAVGIEPSAPTNPPKIEKAPTEIFLV